MGLLDETASTFTTLKRTVFESGLEERRRKRGGGERERRKREEEEERRRGQVFGRLCRV